MRFRMLLLLLLVAAAVVWQPMTPAPLAAQSMELGTNFWNPSWHRPDDCFRNVNEVTGDHPWNPRFLEEIAPYRSFRFMDWDHTNGSTRQRWTERPPKDAARQSPVAYEWMIDLCNRSGADMWVTLPHRTVDRTHRDRPCDYALRMCLLVKLGVDMRDADLSLLLDRLGTMTAAELVEAGGLRTSPPLDAERKLYIEYSNETWNAIFRQAEHCSDEGLALGLDENRRTAGLRFHAWAAIRVFRAADLVFGADSPRVVKVLATQAANPWIAGQHQQVMGDPRHNPWQVQATAVAIAPYFGHGVDGAADDAVERLRAAIDKSAEHAARHRQIADEARLRLIAYEGGQHVTTRAKGLNTNPAMFDLYRQYLQAMSPHIEHFSHYCHVGRAGDGGAWGAIEFTGQPLEQAHKYRALVEFARRPAPP